MEARAPFLALIPHNKRYFQMPQPMSPSAGVLGVETSGFGVDGTKPFSMFITLPLTSLNCTR